MKVVGMIPARLESSRVPRKALADIGGLPMMVHTCKRSQMAEYLDRVYLATDSQEIKEVAELHGIDVIMTGSHHKTGSDRLAEACQQIDCEIVVNIQGDEPLVYPEHIDAVVKPMLEDPTVQIAVGVTPFTKLNSPGDIKAVLDLQQDILYCSRNDIPLYYLQPFETMLKMCFIVPFRKSLLLQYTNWEPTPLELIEDNHFLRVIEHGVKIRTVRIEGAKISVDTPEDLEEVREIMKNDLLKREYM
ncbi:3-deoxy-manno-octulosonate cytidylyltransferase [Acidobacteriota bacterium]